MAGRRGFGAVRQTGSGRWQASYSHDGSRHNAPDTFALKSEADKWLSDVRASIDRGEWIDPDIAGQTFRSYALAWFRDWQGERRPKTRETYAGQLDRYILPYLGEMEMKSITTTTVKEWRAWLGEQFANRKKAGQVGRRNATGATTKAQAYRILHTIMAEAVRDGVIRRNPCVLKGASSSAAAEPTPATLEELNTIAENMPKRYAALIHVAAWSGLRFGELAALTRADVVLAEDRQTGQRYYRIDVNKQAYKVGRKWYSDALPKTGAGRRVVYLPPHLTDTLTAHLGTYVATGNDAIVFGTRNNTIVENSSIGKMYARARKAAKREDLRFHDLRHTGATLSAQAGATTKELMNRMGHSTPRAAMIYQHATEQRDIELAGKLSRLHDAMENDDVRSRLTVIDGGKSERLAA